MNKRHAGKPRAPQITDTHYARNARPANADQASESKQEILFSEPRGVGRRSRRDQRSAGNQQLMRMRLITTSQGDIINLN
jgi:hypothetical protein